MDFKKMEYQRPNYESFKEESAKLYEELKKATTKNEYLTVFQKINDSWNEVVAMYELAYIRYTMDTNDSFYKEEQAYFDEMIPEFDAIHHQFYEIVVDCPWKEELKGYSTTIF